MISKKGLQCGILSISSILEVVSKKKGLQAVDPLFSAGIAISQQVSHKFPQFGWLAIIFWSCPVLGNENTAQRQSSATPSLFGFQHQIAAATAAPVVSFCRSIYYLLSWHSCPNPNSNRKFLEKKNERHCITATVSTALLLKRVQRESILYPQPTGERANNCTTFSSYYMSQSAVFNWNKWQKSNVIVCQCSSD